MLGEEFPRVLLAARAGAGWAWTALYRDLAPTVLGYLRSRGAPEPEDLTGEVFLQVARDLASFDGSESEFRSWVFVLAHHRLLDDRRYRTRRPSEPAAETTLQQFSPVGDVEEEAMGDLATQQVMALMAGLSAPQREVLLLRIVAGLTVEEVAVVTRKRPNSVKALQRRGLAAIRRDLSAEGVHHLRPASAD